MKRCPRCDRTLSLKLFGSNRTTHDGLDGYCRECRRLINIQRQFTITGPEYRQLLSFNNLLCWLCDAPEDSPQNLKKNNVYRHCVDHDNGCCYKQAREGKLATCGLCVRGILCNTCNVRLGKYERLPAVERNDPALNEYLARRPIKDMREAAFNDSLAV